MLVVNTIKCSCSCYGNGCISKHLKPNNTDGQVRSINNKRNELYLLVFVANCDTLSNRFVSVADIGRKTLVSWFCPKYIEPSSAVITCNVGFSRSNFCIIFGTRNQGNSGSNDQQFSFDQSDENVQ